MAASLSKKRLTACVCAGGAAIALSIGVVAACNLNPSDSSAWPVLIVQPDQVVNGQAVLTNGSEIVDIQALAPPGSKLAIAMQNGQFTEGSQTLTTGCSPVPTQGDGLLQVSVNVSVPSETATLSVALLYASDASVEDASPPVGDAGQTSVIDAGSGAPVADPAAICPGYYVALQRALIVSQGTPIVLEAGPESGSGPIGDATTDNGGEDVADASTVPPDSPMVVDAAAETGGDS